MAVRTKHTVCRFNEYGNENDSLVIVDCLVISSVIIFFNLLKWYRRVHKQQIMLIRRNFQLHFSCICNANCLNVHDEGPRLQALMTAARDDNLEVDMLEHAKLGVVMVWVVKNWFIRTSMLIEYLRRPDKKKLRFLDWNLNLVLEREFGNFPNQGGCMRCPLKDENNKLRVCLVVVIDRNS